MLKSIRFFAILSFIEGLITSIWLMSIPSTGGSFSPIRLASLFGMLFISFGCLAVIIFIKPGFKHNKTLEIIVNNKWGIPFSFFLITVSLMAFVTILYRDWLLLSIDVAIYTRLLPLAVYGALLCLQLGILFLIPNIRKAGWVNISKPVWKPAAILLGIFLLIWGFISITHIGFVFDNVGLSWGPPGTPITFAQVNLVFAICLLLAFAYGIFRSRIHPRWLPFRDLVIFAGLWGLAIFLWSNETVGTTHFNPPPMAPNYEVYPNSDALIFDKSSYQLIFGADFNNQLVRRPLYVGMLALFHKIGGVDYESTTSLQILFLALIPSMTYLVTSKLSNRLAGLLAGGLILLREKNAIGLSDKIATSNAKLMMSDMFAMLGIIMLMYFMVIVLSDKKRNLWLLGIAGACLGLTALVRAQVLILLPLLIIFIFMERKPILLRGKDSLIIILGLVLALSPWIWRNWNLTGTFVLDDQGEEKLLARNYSADPVAFPSVLPGESEQDYSTRIRQGILLYIIEHPTDVAFFISNHFLRNMATSAVYIAPMYSTASPRDLVDQTGFWDGWDGLLPGNTALSLFINITIIAFGISAARSKNKSAGEFLLFSFLLYSIGNALVRTSGWRFSLPADWVILVYFGIALAYIPSKLNFVYYKNNAIQSEPRISSTFQKLIYGPLLFFILLLAGAAIPIAERLIPNQDLSFLTNNAQENLSLNNFSQSEIDDFLKQENAVFYSGIALYPRYIGTNSRIYLAYIPREFKLFHFWMINYRDNQIVLPLDKSPAFFPHASTVSVIGCQEENYILAHAVILHEPIYKIITQENQSSLSCP